MSSNVSDFKATESWFRDFREDFSSDVVVGNKSDLVGRRGMLSGVNVGDVFLQFGFTIRWQ
jgi:GTPase SAR1 family protein